MIKINCINKKLIIKFNYFYFILCQNTLILILSIAIAIPLINIRNQLER